VTVNPASGQGAGAVTITVAANAQASPRSAAVAVNDTRVTVSQEPSPCRFELGSQSVRVGFEGGPASVRVSTMDGCEWRAAGSGGWVHVLTESGNGSGTVDMDVERNSGPERSVTLSIAGSSFVVVQNAVREAGSPNPSSCSFSIDPDRTTVRSAGGQGSVRVATDPDCAWTASTGASWIAVQRFSGSGPDTVTYHVSANVSTTSDRSGSISVAGHTHRVTQQACELTLESGLPNLPPSAGTYNFRVITNPSCVWTANSNVGWITLVNASGTGGTALTYRLAANPISQDRVGTIVVSGRAKVITQQALGQGGQP
jgi:hypothetical protein